MKSENPFSYEIAEQRLQEKTPNESDSIPKTGIELAYLPGSSVPRLMISI